MEGVLFLEKQNSRRLFAIKTQNQEWLIQNAIVDYALHFDKKVCGSFCMHLV